MGMLAKCTLIKDSPAMYNLTGKYPWVTSVSKRQWVNLGLFCVGKALGLLTALLVCLGAYGFETREASKITFLLYGLFIFLAIGMALTDWIRQTTKEKLTGTCY